MGIRQRPISWSGAGHCIVSNWPRQTIIDQPIHKNPIRKLCWIKFYGCFGNSKICPTSVPLNPTCVGDFCTGRTACPSLDTNAFPLTYKVGGPRSSISALILNRSDFRQRPFQPSPQLLPDVMEVSLVATTPSKTTFHEVGPEVKLVAIGFAYRPCDEDVDLQVALLFVTSMTPFWINTGFEPTGTPRLISL